MMKKIAAIALFACACATGSVFAQTSVGVSIGINQPGVYGRINIGNYPPPVLVYPQPVIIAPAPVLVQREPIYLYVPPGHQKKWGKHCARYNACGQPVYFVQEQWVRERYAHEHPGWRDDRRDRRDHRDNRRQDHDDHRERRDHDNRR
ncbi:MAG: hypothetical protein Q7T10_17540 [Rhodoferax sp.]|nr:hypothetical protein [Rhodoferax sp.]